MSNTLILFPGFGFCPTVMDTLAEKLSPHYQVSVADLSEPFDIIKSRIPENSTLLGWSLGGLFALKIANLMPIKKLILTASNPCFIAEEEWPGIDPQFFNDFRSELTTDINAALQKFAYLQVQGMPDERNAYKLIKGYLSKVSCTKTLLDILKVDMRKVLAKINCPIHFILGEKDPIVPITLVDKIKHLKPEARISIVENAGHVPVLFDIEAIVNHVI